MRPTALSLGTALLCASSLIPTAPMAQEVLHETLGGDAYGEYGSALAVAGDVDGDGSEDLWAGRPDPFGISSTPAGARLVSGRDGSTLRTLASSDPLEHFGRALASGADLDGDGTPDVVVGAPRSSAAAFEGGRVVAFAGAPGASVLPLWERTGLEVEGHFGSALLLLDDLDGDGAAELLVGAPGEPLGTTLGAGAVHVLSGATGATLTVFRSSLPDGELGFALAKAEDQDGDGYVDFLVGAPGAGLSVAAAGLVLLQSGRNGRVLRILEAPRAGDRFGHSVASAGDVDADGSPDVIVGAPGRKYARVFSGATGALLLTFQRAYPENGSSAPFGTVAKFGTSVAGVGDQDGDGHDDVAVGYPAHSSVTLFSGADGSELARHAAAHQVSLTGGVMSVFFGWTLAPLDVDGEEPPELAVGAPYDAARAPSQPTTADSSGSVTVLRPAMDPEWDTSFPNRVFGPGDLDRDGYDDLLVEEGGEVRLVSSRTSNVLWRSAGRSLAVAARAGDADADGVPDVVLGEPGFLGTLGHARLLSGASGKELLSVDGLEVDDLFGYSVSGVGDVNGDGHADFAVGAPRVLNPSRNPLCILEPGYVRIFSGRDGALLRELLGDGYPGWDCSSGPIGDAFGFVVLGVGDWSGDGVPDLAVAAPGAGYPFTSYGLVRVFSGADGSLLREHTTTGVPEFGVSLAGGPRFDVDADGISDLVVGYQQIGYGPYAQIFGGATVFSGADGGVLLSVGGEDPPQGYQGNLLPNFQTAALHDFDGDGHSDVAFGNSVLAGEMGPSQGEVLVRSGRDGSLLARLEGTSSWDYLGYTVLGLGDLDRDGSDEIVFEASANGNPSSYHRWRVLRGPGRDGGEDRGRSKPGPR